MDGKTALSLTDVLASLSLLLAASATVERVLEFLDRAIESIGAASERLMVRTLGRRSTAQEGTRALASKAATAETSADGTADDPEGVPFALVLLEEGKPKERRVVVKRFIVQAVGCALGTVLCFKGQLGIFKMLGSGFPAWLDFILTGILIGAGTEPIHNLIRFLQEKRQTAMAEVAPVGREEKPPAAAAGVSAPTVIVPKPPVIGIDYDGGWTPEKFEDRKRKHDPDMIIYHHTATHSDATFVDIVKIIEARGFATGYNCVITADGQYHHYCRWDARGIHAKGYNERSLGVAFVGSFETDPTVPNSNPDGRLGNQMPTDAQLTTGARLVALWMLLYGIKDLTKKILPHKAVAPKACPGNNFPYQRFLEMVKTFGDEWVKSPQAISELQDLSHKKYVYVEPAEGGPRKFTVSRKSSTG